MGPGLIGAILTVGGVAASAAIVYDMSTGRASFGDVIRDIAVFIEGWIAELITRGGHNDELEKTHAYALCILLLPGLLLLSYNLILLFKRGNEFQIELDGSVSARCGATCPHFWNSSTRSSPQTEHRSSSGRRRGGGCSCYPAARVLTRIRRSTAGENQRGFFRRRLTGRGFDLDEGSTGDHFTARRKS